MKDDLPQKLDDKEIVKRYIKSIDKGLLKVMSKMGISTYQSYCGAQIFDAIGLKSDFVATYFTGTATRIEGVGLTEIAEETVQPSSPRVRRCADLSRCARRRRRICRAHARRGSRLDVGDGRALQHAVRGNLPDKYREFAHDRERPDRTACSPSAACSASRARKKIGRKPVPIDEVEPAKNIVRRFSTGAMSYGSISREAHTTLAIAMNRIGGKSNTGEGGEEATASSRCRTAIRCARRSSRWPRDVLASPPNISSIPT